MENIVAIVGIIGLIIIAVKLLYLFSSSPGPNKEETPNYKNIYSRIVYEDTILGLGWRYYVEIYAFIPYQEKILFRSQPFKDRDEAKEYEKIILKEFKNE